MREGKETLPGQEEGTGGGMDSDFSFSSRFVLL